jgi:hypothetical protein
MIVEAEGEAKYAQDKRDDSHEQVASFRRVRYLLEHGEPRGRSPGIIPQGLKADDIHAIPQLRALIRAVKRDPSELQIPRTLSPREAQLQAARNDNGQIIYLRITA